MMSFGVLGLFNFQNPLQKFSFNRKKVIFQVINFGPAFATIIVCSKHASNANFDVNCSHIVNI